VRKGGLEPDQGGGQTEDKSGARLPQTKDRTWIRFDVSRQSGNISGHPKDTLERSPWCAFGAPDGSVVDLPSDVPESVIIGLINWDRLPDSVKVAVEVLLGDSSRSAT